MPAGAFVLDPVFLGGLAFLGGVVCFGGIICFGGVVCKGRVCVPAGFNCKAGLLQT